MPLSDTAIRSAKPDAKDIKLSDERGLYLLVAKTGGKLWRFKYRFEGKEKKLSFGSYPDVPLKEARRRRDEARTQLANGHDPSALKKAERAAKGERTRNTFDGVAEEYLTHMERDGRQANTVGKARWLYSLMKDDLGPRPIADITPAEILAVLRTIEAKGNHETARRMRSLASRIFRFGAATSRVSADPTSLLRGALIAPKVKHHSAIVDVKEVGPLLRAIDGFTGQPLTKLALQLTPHVFVRPGELRRAEWKEFNLSEAVWTIPADKMKMRRPHRVPLSRQSLAILDAAFSISAKQQYVFSSMYPGTRPMSENTINAALRRLGYSGKEMTAHGFRSMASTLLNESGLWREDAIERALAHQETNAVRGAYHRGQHWDERVDMAQWWSDFLDEQRGGSEKPKR
jgi:integrase